MKRQKLACLLALLLSCSSVWAQQDSLWQAFDETMSALKLEIGSLRTELQDMSEQLEQSRAQLQTLKSQLSEVQTQLSAYKDLSARLKQSLEQSEKVSNNRLWWALGTTASSILLLALSGWLVVR